MKRVMLFSIGAVLVLFFVSIIHAQDDPTVYVTKTGSKYHNAGCSSLKKSAIPMKLSEAATKYSPCSRCNPPLPSSDVKSSTSSKSNVSTTPQKNVTDQSQAPKRTGETQVGTTPKGYQIYEGPRGGRYHYSKSGKKVYERKKR
jgi:hypothetical protein